MRLINADALISRLNDYALQNAPIYGRRQNDSAYDTIQNCIKAVGECKSVNCVQEIKRQVENTHQDLGGLEPYKNERWFKIGLDLMYDQIMDIIKHMGSKETGWIPVSERMPKEFNSGFLKLKGTSRWDVGMYEKSSERVLVLTNWYGGKYFAVTAMTVDGVWEVDPVIRLNGESIGKPVAWMPLPEPYREE